MAAIISLSIREDLYRWLEEEAKSKNKKVQDVIREALEEIRALRKYRIDKILSIIESLDELRK